MRIVNKIYNFLYTCTYDLTIIPMKIYDFINHTDYSGIDKTVNKGEGRYEYYPSPVMSFPRLGKYIRKHLQGGRGHRVLDIGCGKGFMLLFFSTFSFEGR